MEHCCETADQNEKGKRILEGEAYEVDDVQEIVACAVSECSQADVQTVVGSVRS